ncbi:contractile injection system tape measure protein [Nannocystis sp.]|uniref:contractile injection system tape measure protein n=1 Tax=Nannocystis sp. TaxID=1962667 RepID=UPI0025E7255F|nr:contractile injection system tape measure protein [Nannocystis sp.]MBK7826425.1 hypothetical protein [Nannocystis sp.]
MASHRVNHVEIELRVGDVELATDLIERTSRLHERRISPLLDRLLGEHSDPAQIDRLDRLELDLGNLDVDDFEDDLLRKLEAALRTALRQALADRRSDVRGDAPLELLTTFATTGNLPWWADASRGDPIAAASVTLLREAPAALLTLLAELADDPVARTRLARHLDAACLDTLVGLRWPAARLGLPAALQLLTQQLDAAPQAGPRRLLRLRQAILTAVAHPALAPTQALRSIVLQLADLPGWRPAAPQRPPELPPALHAALAAALTELHARGSSHRDTGPDPNHDITTPQPSPDPDPTSLQPAELEPPELRELREPRRVHEPSPPTRPHDDRLPEPEPSKPAPAGPAEPHAHELEPTPPTERTRELEPTPPTEATRELEPTRPSEIPRELEPTPPTELEPTPTTEPPEHRSPAVAVNEPDPHHPHADPRETTAPHATPQLAAPRPTRPPPRRPRARPDELYVEDAGLVILWPFLDRFFLRVGLLDDERRFIDEPASMQAIALLAQLASEDPDPPEFTLPLAKLLVGRSPTDSFTLARPLAGPQIDECERLLAAVIAHATILRDMPVASFRATFLRRPAALTTRDGAWTLQVEARTHDLVLARFPWAWSWVKLPWMPDPLRVEWA